MRRNPRKDPIPGDVVEFRTTPKSETWGRFRVQRIGDDGTVFYWDEGFIDYVPLKRWREWFVGRRGIRVTPNA